MKFISSEYILDNQAVAPSASGESLDDSLVFIDEYIDLDSPNGTPNKNEQSEQDVKPVVLSKVAPMPNAFVFKIEGAESMDSPNTTQNKDQESVQDVKPVVLSKFVISKVAPMPNAIIVKSEDTFDVANNSVASSSSDSTFSLSDLTVEDRTEDLQRLYARSKNQSADQPNKAVTRLDFN